MRPLKYWNVNEGHPIKSYLDADYLKKVSMVFFQLSDCNLWTDMKKKYVSNKINVKYLNINLFKGIGCISFFSFILSFECKHQTDYKDSAKEIFTI